MNSQANNEALTKAREEADISASISNPASGVEAMLYWIACELRAARLERWTTDERNQ